MKYLYKYPQEAYPYDDLVATNRRRGRNDLEYELLDTGVFNEDRYFDVFVEYAKASPDDILIQITRIQSRARQAAMLHLLPTLWFRNTWTWWPERAEAIAAAASSARNGVVAIAAAARALGDYLLHCEGRPRLLFTENETNNERLFGTPNRALMSRTASTTTVVTGRQDAVNPAGPGTKAAAHYQLSVGAGRARSVRLRLTNAAPDAGIRSARV